MLYADAVAVGSWIPVVPDVGLPALIIDAVGSSPR